jgi:hypothetical protein
MMNMMLGFFSWAAAGLVTDAKATNTAHNAVMNVLFISFILFYSFGSVKYDSFPRCSCFVSYTILRNKLLIFSLVKLSCSADKYPLIQPSRRMMNCKGALRAFDAAQGEGLADRILTTPKYSL